MSNNIRSILDRLATVEGRLSPAQQRVPQLPALFKPQHIRALGSKTDPAHPMDGYMVGDSAEPRRTALEEAMAEIEEDMLSKVKRDLTHYLDRLEKKVSISRDLKDKAVDAVERGEAEEGAEELDELDFSGNTAPPSDSESDYQQAKTAVGQQVDNYKSAASMADAAAKSGSISPQDAQSAKSQLAGNMMRGGIAAGQAAITGNNPEQAYQGSMVKSIGNTVADSGITPQVAQQAAATAQQYRGPGAKDITKDPQFAKLPLAKQQQISQAQKQISGMSDDDFANVKNFDAKKAGADLRATGQGIANSQKTDKSHLDKKATANVPSVNAALGINPATPAATFEMSDGKSLGCYGNDDQGYELRHGEQALPSRFRSLDDAGMAVKLYQARKRAQQRDSNTDYIEER